MSSVLQSISLLNTSFTAQFQITLENKSSHKATDINIHDQVSSADNVISNLSATVSYSPNPVVVNSNTLFLPTISELAGDATFTFTLALNATLTPGGQATLTQVFEAFYIQGCKEKKTCFTMTNSATGKDCDVISLELSNTVPTVISAPGHYQVINSPNMQITGATTAASNSAIIITSSDVHLDLCENVLTGSGNKTAPLSPQPTVPGGIQNDTRVDACRGIVVQGTSTNILDNITIANGKLQFYSLSAIRAVFASDIICQDLVIENSGTVTEPITSGIGGVLFTDCDHITCNRISFQSNRTFDISVADTNVLGHVNISNIVSSGLRGGAFAAFNPAWLAMPQYVQDGIYANSFFLRNPGGTVPIQNFIIEDCDIGDIKAGSNLFGIFVTGRISGIAIRRCHITGLAQTIPDFTIFGSLGGTTPNHEIRGIAVETRNSSILIEDCTVQDLSMSLIKIPLPINFGVNNCVGYNLERSLSKVVRNCVASNIRTDGNVTCLVPDLNGKLISENDAIGFQNEEEQQFGLPQNYQLIGCTASTINGANNPANPAGPSSGYGFSTQNTVNGVSPVFTPGNLFSGHYLNCLAQDVKGNSDSAGFSIFFRSGEPANLIPYGSVVFENCVAQHDRLSDPTGLSHGFVTEARGHDIVFRGCTAVGHNLNGFDLAGYTADTPTGNAKFILDNCISNGNSGHGFRLDQSLKLAELIDCKATNNGLDGINAAGRNLIFRNSVADLNLGKGFFLDQFYPFFAKVATDATNAGMANLGVYGGAYTVQYVPGSVAGPQYFQYFNIIPNNSAAPLPANLTINGVTVNSGDIVLIKDLSGADPNTGGARNGVYVASNTGGVVVAGITVPVWQLTRVDPWRATNVVPSGTKILVAQSNAPNLTPGPVMYTLNVAVTVDTTVITAANFAATQAVAPDRSTIVVDNCKFAENSLNGFHNRAKDVTVRKCVADRNGGIGFLDDSVGGAAANANLYTKNKAFNNAAGTTLGNYTIDYVILANPTVLLSGTIIPAVFPSSTATEANVSITPS